MSRIRLRIREVAEQHHLREMDLARGSGLSFSTIRRLFNNPYSGVKFSTLVKISKALGVSPSCLIDNDSS